MTNFELMFVNPWLLLLLIPAIGVALVPFFMVPKKYRNNRNRITSLVLHCVAITLAVFLLSGVTYSYDIRNKENEIIILVDSSDSSVGETSAKDEFIQELVDLCGENYKVGIVKFGYDQLYVAEMNNDAQEAYRQYIQSADPDTSATDVAAALQYASKLFKRPETSKIVLVSDGVETDGSAIGTIKSIAAEGIKVDTAFFPNEKHDEVQIMGIELPEYKINIGDSFVIKMKIKSNFGFDENNPGTDPQRNIMQLTVYDNDTASEPVSLVLSKGEQIVEIRHSIDLPGLHQLKFEITNEADGIEQNNTYYSYIKLDDLNNILLIEHRSGESEKLQTLLTENYGFNVTAMGIDQNIEDIPRTIKELCAYEQVILVNIANSEIPAGFDELLYKYVHQFGGGLLTVGGENDEVNGKLVPHAYNPEDMATSTYFADMLPVQAINYTPPVAIMLVIDCSGSMSMDKLPMAKEGALMCLDALSSRDYCGVMSFDTEAGKKIEVLPMSQRDKIVKAINEVDKRGDGAGSGGTVFATAIDNAGRALASVNVERRHIIIVTDGNPTDSLNEYGPYIDANLKNGVTMSVVGIHMDSTNVPNMEETCERGNGKFYDVDRLGGVKNLPNIMQSDMEMNAVGGINYGEEFTPTVRDHTAIFAGVDLKAIPPLSGYYGTKVKEGAIVPLMGEFVPIYAQWKFGEGTVGSFMSDLDGIWSAKFISDPVGQTLISNIVKNLFPAQAIKSDELDALLRQDNYTVQVSVSSKRAEGDTVELNIKPLTEEAQDFYQEKIPVQVADGFTRFTFDITCPGIYEISIDKKDAGGNVLANYTIYYTFAYSQEYNYFPEKEPIGEKYMESLAEDGRGILVEYAIDIFDSFDKYIHKVIDPSLAMIIAVIVLFLLDIAVRKFKFKWPHEIVRDYKQNKADKSKH